MALSPEQENRITESPEYKQARRNDKVMLYWVLFFVAFAGMICLI